MIPITATTAGKVIAGLYRSLGMSQRDFARKLAAATNRNFDGLKAQLWTWEAGTRNPDLVSVEKALKELGFVLAVVPETGDAERAKMLAVLAAARVLVKETWHTFPFPALNDLRDALNALDD
jgi:transcriptional regulator with XRE-family HTH domain